MCEDIQAECDGYGLWPQIGCSIIGLDAEDGEWIFYGKDCIVDGKWRLPFAYAFMWGGDSL